MHAEDASLNTVRIAIDRIVNNLPMALHVRMGGRDFFVPHTLITEVCEDETFIRVPRWYVNDFKLHTREVA